MAGVTEDTVSDLLASYLRREGINALTQFTVDFPVSWGKPDIKLEDGGYFFGEAEWEGKEWEGFGEARDYLQAPNATGTFVITYPTKLKKELSQARLRRVKESRLSMYEPVLSKFEYRAAFLRIGQKTDMKTLDWEEIPHWFRMNIEAKKVSAADLGWTISILRQTAEELTRELKKNFGRKAFFLNPSLVIHQLRFPPILLPARKATITATMIPIPAPIHIQGKPSSSPFAPSPPKRW